MHSHSKCKIIIDIIIVLIPLLPDLLTTILPSNFPKTYSEIHMHAYEPANSFKYFLLSSLRKCAPCKTLVPYHKF